LKSSTHHGIVSPKANGHVGLAYVCSDQNAMMPYQCLESVYRAHLPIATNKSVGIKTAEANQSASRSILINEAREDG
jgi:hypothetical protein